MTVKILVLRAPGTNCDVETARALREAGARVDVVHTNRLVSHKVDIFDYHGLVLPGGFSYGDRVRAGVIWARKLGSHIGERLLKYAEEGWPILGICNGFQVLVELGLLPGWNGEAKVQAALAPNASARFEARWVYLRHESQGRCIFTRSLPVGSILMMPVAHGEGRFVLAGREMLSKLVSGKQVVFRYALPDGRPADGLYPFNPNGSFFDGAGICNPKGNVLGLMPHPERALYGWQLPEQCGKKYSDGWLIFRNMVQYISEKLL